MSQGVSMTRNGSGMKHTRICVFCKGWILDAIKNTTCHMHHRNFSRVEEEEEEKMDYWTAVKVFMTSNKRIGKINTWWICALCTRSFGRRGLLSGNLSSKYCKRPHPLLPSNLAKVSVKEDPQKSNFLTEKAGVLRAMHKAIVGLWTCHFSF